MLVEGAERPLISVLRRGKSVSDTLRIMPNEPTMSDAEANRLRANRLIAFSYVRVSSSPQDYDGHVEGQIVEIATWAKLLHVVADRFYADRAVSLWQRGSRHRDGAQVALRQLQQDIVRERDGRAIIVGVDVSRFARNRDKGREFFEWVMEHGFTVYTLDEVFTPDELSASNWFDRCVEAEEEIIRNSASADRQHREREAVFAQTGRPSWGFASTGITRHIREAHGQLVERLYSEFFKGATLTQLAQTLADSGLWHARDDSPARRKKKVKQLLQEPNFAGLQKFPRVGGVRRLGPTTYPGVVSYQDFFLMQQLVPHRVLGSRRQRFYMLGRVNCEQCRKPLVPADINYLRQDGQHEKFVKHAYVCPEGGCHPPRVYDADLMHLTLKMRLQEHEYRSGDKGFYTRWMNASRTEQRSMLRDNFHFNFIATQDGVEWPSRLRNPA